MTTKRTGNSTCSTVLFSAGFFLLAFAIMCIVLLNFGEIPVPEVLVYPASEGTFDEILTPMELPIGAPGAYYYLGEGEGKILCTSESSCLHEVGHHLDHLLDMPSFSEEWEYEVNAFLTRCLAGVEHFFCNIESFPGVYRNPMSIFSLPNGYTTEWGGYSELYAQIYSVSIILDQDIPLELQIFYSTHWKGE